jgi:hypothetical protein
VGPAAWACAAALALALAGGAAAADKVDLIHFRNGDRLTCEIKNLDRSVLTISTDPLGSASVHWGEVADLLSPRLFDVQLASGQHFLGSLAASVPGQMALQLVGGGTATVPLEEVIRMAPIGSSIRNRINGSVDAGFSFAQADLETHWTLNGAATCGAHDPAALVDLGWRRLHERAVLRRAGGPVGRSGDWRQPRFLHPARPTIKSRTAWSPTST